MTAKIKIKKLISRTKFESAQKDATELHSVVERLGLRNGFERREEEKTDDGECIEFDNTPNVTTFLEIFKMLGVPVVSTTIIAFLIFLGRWLLIAPNIDIKFKYQDISPDTYPNRKSFIDKYGNRYRHLLITNYGKTDVDFWVDSCKYIDENGRDKERNIEDYPMNYNMKIPYREVRIQIPALWDPNIELEKTSHIIWRIKARDVLGFRHCSCRVFKSKNVGVYTGDGKMWHKRNKSFLFYRKCKLFGGCLYDHFGKGAIKKNE